MTSDEVLTALRCCASGSCDGCPLWDDDPEDTTCADGLMAAAADLIEFQRQGLEALTKMDEGLKKRGSTLKEFLRRGDEVVQGTETLPDRRAIRALRGIFSSARRATRRASSITRRKTPTSARVAGGRTRRADGWFRTRH